MEEELLYAIRKRALGYESQDSVREYSLENGELVLTKEKKTKKYVAPDIMAIKALVEFLNKTNDLDFKKLTDEELKQEKQKLLAQIAEELKIEKEEKIVEEEKNGD